VGAQFAGKKIFALSGNNKIDHSFYLIKKLLISKAGET